MELGEEPEKAEENPPALESENSRVSFKLQDDIAIITPREEIAEEIEFPAAPEDHPDSPDEIRSTGNSVTLEESHPTAIPLQVA